MLHLFRNNNSFTEVEQIKNDFGQLYDNIAEIHDFFDEEYSKSGDFKKVEEKLIEKFKNCVIYKNNFIEIVITSISVKEGKIIGLFGIDIEENAEMYLSKLWLQYFDNYFWDELWFDFTVPFEVLEIKQKIEKIVDLFVMSEEFKYNWYNFLHSTKAGYLYKKMDVVDKTVLNQFSSKGIQTYIWDIKYYFKFIKRLLSKNYKVVQVSDIEWKIFIDEETHFSLSIYIDDSKISYFSLTGLYMGIHNLPYEKVEEIHKILEKKINFVNQVLEEKKKLSRIVKKSKSNIFKTLDYEHISENIEPLIQKYHNLSEKWDIFGNVASGLLLNIKLDLSGLGVPVEDYAISNYKKLVDAILKESYDVIMNYYIKKLYSLIKRDNKSWILQILMRIIEIPEAERMNKLLNMEDLEIFLTSSYIEMLIDSISEEDERAIFINQLYVIFLKKDNKESIINLEKYKDIHKYHVTEHIKEDFYKLLIKNIVFDALNENNRDFMLKPLQEVVGELNLWIYIEDIDKFEKKYKWEIYHKYYKELIQRDSIFIDYLNEKSFSVYRNIDEDNIDNFIETILIPHLLLVLHKMDREEVRKHTELLEQGYMIEVLDTLEYPEIPKDIVFQSWNEKDHCKDVLFYWSVLEGLPELDNYNKSSIESEIKNEIEWMLEKILEKEEKSSWATSEQKSFVSFEDKISKFINLVVEKYNRNTSMWLTSFEDKLISHMLDYASVDDKKKLAEVRDLADDIYIKLAQDTNDEVVLALINGQESLPYPIWTIIANNPSERVVSTYINRYKLSEDSQNIVWTSEKGMMQLLNNQRTLRWWVVIKMAKYGSDKVKKRLIEYSNELGQETQRILIQDKNEEIVMKLLWTQKTIYSKSANWIANDASDRIKMKFIERYKLSEDIQRILIQDKNEEIVMKLLWTQKTIYSKSANWIANDASDRIKMKFIKRYNLSWEIQKILARDSEKIVLYMLEHKKKLEDGVWVIVAEHPSLKVRRIFAKWSLSEETALKLAKKEEDEKLLLNLILSWKEDYYKSVLLELAKKDSEKIWRRIVNDFSKMNVDVLLELVKHPSLKVRRRLAKWDLSKKIALKLAKKEEDEELLLNLILSWKEDYYTSVLLELAKKDSKKIWLHIVNTFQTLTPNIIKQLKNHPSQKVQQAVVEQFNV